MNLETGIRLWRWGNAVSCFGVVQFLCLCALAAVWYPGGTLLERDTVGYSFSENFLSDLGRTQSWSGQPNATACVLFNTAAVVLGVSIIPFFLFLPLHAPDQSRILWIAAGSGVASALALTGIGLTPYDVRFEAHHTALFFWVVFLLVTVLLHAGAFLMSEGASPLFGVLSLGLVGVIVLYLLGGIEFLLSSSLGSREQAFVGFVSTQKYVMLAAVAWYLVFSVRMVCTTEFPSADRDSTVDLTAEAYSKWLEEGRWRARRQE
jgi:hypothetical membrane protein